MVDYKLMKEPINLLSILYIYIFYDKLEKHNRLYRVKVRLKLIDIKLNTKQIFISK